MAPAISATGIFFVSSPPPTTPSRSHPLRQPYRCSTTEGIPPNSSHDLASPFGCRCCVPGRRSFLLGGPLVASTLPESTAYALSDPSVLTDAKFRRPFRPGWYEELFATAMSRGMESYEAEIARYKKDLFSYLDVGNKNVLEIGVGTGPNLKYYANASGVSVYGVDPNKRMEKYARQAAEASGLLQTSFNFIQGVAEALPVDDNSMDAVLGTLVLCSVNDIETSLKEVKRILKPSGIYIFIEHVAARDESLRFLQIVLDPLQQFLADGCHLTRETGNNILEAGFSDVQISQTTLPNLSILGPHIYGIARK